jgi:hypothetical protein
MNERNLQKTEKVLVSVQRFYESKLRDWAFDCQQNQARSFTVAARKSTAPRYAT